MLALLAALAAIHLPPADRPCQADHGVPGGGLWGGRLERASIPLTGAGKPTGAAAVPPGWSFDFSSGGNATLLALS